MGFFNRKKDEEVKIQLEREALDKLSENDISLFEIPTDSTINSDWKISGKTKAPHTITAEELNSKKLTLNSTDENIAEEIPMSKSDDDKDYKNESPANFLYQKMMQSRAKISENSIEASKNKVDLEEDLGTIIVETQVTEKSQPLDIDAAIDDLKNIAKNYGANEKSESNAESDSDLILDSNPENNNVTVSEDEISTEICSSSEKEVDFKPETPKEDSLKSNPILEKEIVLSDNPNSVPPTDDLSNMGANAEERRATLLARCNAFLEDDSGPIKANVEKYKLESVESILKGFETRAAERAIKKFNTNASTFSLSVDEKAPNADANTLNTTENTNDNPILFTEDSSFFDESKNDAQATENSLSNQVKHLFVADTKKAEPDTEYEDISSTKLITNINKSTKPDFEDFTEKTSVFPVVEPIIDTNHSKTDNIESNSEPDLKNADECSNIDDYTTIADRKRVLSHLLKNKRSFVLKALLSLFAFIVAIVTINPISNNLNLSESTTSIIDLLVCLFLLFVNFNVLTAIINISNSKSKSSLPASFSLIIATVFSIINLVFKGDLAGFSSIAALTLLSYNFANKNFYSKTIKNFNIIANEETKNAVSIIQNKGATKTIVGNAIDGSALVCYGGETTNIHNFLKYTYCKNPISDKIKTISVVGIIIGVLLAAVSFIFNSSDFVLALYIFTACICLTSIPVSYHIVSLTVNAANKRLNHYGAMITGYRAADELELCNCIAIGSNDLFPDGTIRLVDMKLLSPNPFDQSMLDAAAIADAIHSPLAGIFKQIDMAKSYNSSEQEVDSVIYEEKMGISGWVNDRRVFVGNRDLLIAHGFAGLPPAELDKKIMRKGYFPVYIASDNILCALLIVKYEPDENIIYEIQRLANTGTTFLVDNCDPNISSKMLEDYFELYDETVFVMSKLGSDYYKALTPNKEHRRAGAVYKSRIEGLLASLTAAINIKKHISRMTVFYVLGSVLGLLSVAACLFTSLTSLITPLNILIFHLVFTAITLLPPLLRKP